MTTNESLTAQVESFTAHPLPAFHQTTARTTVDAEARTVQVALIDTDADYYETHRVDPSDSAIDLARNAWYQVTGRRVRAARCTATVGAVQTINGWAVRLYVVAL